MTTGATVLLIDDEASIRASLGQALELAGFDVVALPNADGLDDVLAAGFHGVVLSDVRLPGRDGLEVLAAVRAHDPSLPVVLMTGHGEVPMAVHAMRLGAFDFIEKPFRPESMINVLRHAIRMLARPALAPAPPDGRSVRPAARAPGGGPVAGGHEPPDESVLAGRLIGGSPAMRRLRERVIRYAAVNADVLIRGETGSGKEEVARALHDLGSRATGRFVAVNCGALPADLVGSELFGHEPGAFTGARARRVGKFEHAHGGTVFLDEIESMPLSLQTELLRILQERRFTRVGGNEEVVVDIRVLAAAKVDLQAWAREGRFREDLYYRLNVLAIDLPPLRERLEDVPALFRAFVRQAAGHHGLAAPEIADTVLEAMAGRAWPGNVRELQNTALRFVLDHGLGLHDESAADPSGSAGGLPEGGGLGAGDGAGGLAARVAAFEAGLVQAALDRHEGDLAGAEQELEISRRTLHEKIRRYGLVRRRRGG